MPKTVKERFSAVSGESYLVRRSVGKCKLKYQQVYTIKSWTALDNELRFRAKSQVKPMRVFFTPGSLPHEVVARIPSQGVKIHCFY